MRRVLVGAVLFVLAFVAPAIGSTPSVFAIYGWIDSPSTYMSQPYGPDFNITGWTFDCRSGQQPPFVAVLDHDMSLEGTGKPTVKWIVNYTVNRALVRPDVQAAYDGACPGLSANTGYTVYITEPLTPGLHFLTVFWTTGDGLARSNGVAVDVP